MQRDDAKEHMELGKFKFASDASFYRNQCQHLGVGWSAAVFVKEEEASTDVPESLQLR